MIADGQTDGRPGPLAIDRSILLNTFFINELKMKSSFSGLMAELAIRPHHHAILDLEPGRTEFCAQRDFPDRRRAALAVRWTAAAAAAGASAPRRRPGSRSDGNFGTSIMMWTPPQAGGPGHASPPAKWECIFCISLFQSSFSDFAYYHDFAFWFCIFCILSGKYPKIIGSAVKICIF